VTGHRGLLTKAESLAARSTALCIWFQPWSGLIQIWLCAKASSSCDASSYSISSRFLRMLSLALSNSLDTLPITPDQPSASCSGAPLKHICDGEQDKGLRAPADVARRKGAAPEPPVDETVGHSKAESSAKPKIIPVLRPRLPNGRLPRREPRISSLEQRVRCSPRFRSSSSTPPSSSILRLLDPHLHSNCVSPSCQPRALSWAPPASPSMPRPMRLAKTLYPTRGVGDYPAVRNSETAL
jgi:hypothetical protein